MERAPSGMRGYLRRMSLRAKLFLPIVGLVAVVLIVVLLLLSARVRSNTYTSIEVDFRRTRATFDRFRAVIADFLVERAILLSEVPQMKGAMGAIEANRGPDVTLQDHDTIKAGVDFLLKIADFELAIVTDRQGRVLFRTDHPESFGEDISDDPSVARALTGMDPDQTRIWILDGDVWQVASVVIYGGEYPIGTLTIGTLLGQEAAEELKQTTGSDVSFLVEHRVIASTLPEESRVDLAKTTFAFQERIEAARESGAVTEAIPTRLSGERFLVSFADIGTARGGERVSYALGLSLDQALAPLRRLQVIIVLLAVLSILIASGVSYLIANGITRPVTRLVEGAHRIEAGNYEFSIPVTTQDEIGTLAKAFNEMTTGLRERFHMERFVSSSTLDMIRRGDSEEGVPASERKNVTVLFSDIRGFTAFSEKVDPEEVVAMLNMYLSKQARTVSRFGGVVDKYVGDELVAVFEGEDSADQAVLCSVEIQREMHRLREQLPQKIQVGIGVNTGMVVMGEVGSQERMDYTVLGSNVNLGARLCSTAEPGQILISESSYRMLRIKVATTPLDAITVKGFSRPIQVYSVG